MKIIRYQNPDGKNIYGAELSLPAKHSVLKAIFFLQASGYKRTRPNRQNTRTSCPLRQFYALD